MFGNLGFTEILLIAVIALVLFGPNKLPELGRSLGRTYREFKNGARDLLEDVQKPPTQDRRDVTPSPSEPVRPSTVAAEAAQPSATAQQPKERPAADSRRLPD